MRNYPLHDRSYPAQIFNRVIHRNHNSHRTATGRYRIQSMYANGESPTTYAGLIDSNVIGAEVVTHFNSKVALRVYIDGMGIYRPGLFRVLPFYMRRQIDDMIREVFDFVKTIPARTLGEGVTHHIKRKPICEEFQQEYINTDSFSNFLEIKYNIPRGEHAEI